MLRELNRESYCTSGTQHTEVRETCTDFVGRHYGETSDVKVGYNNLLETSEWMDGLSDSVRSRKPTKDRNSQDCTIV